MTHSLADLIRAAAPAAGQPVQKAHELPASAPAAISSPGRRGTRSAPCPARGNWRAVFAPPAPFERMEP